MKDLGFNEKGERQAGDEEDDINGLESSNTENTAVNLDEIELTEIHTSASVI